ncbi:MAG: ATP-binding protein [Paracoccaceae bacterium]
MKRLLPGSLRGQLVLVILAALALAQGLGLWLFADERALAVRAALGQEAAGRAANVARLLADAPADLRPAILRAADSPLVRFTPDTAPAVENAEHGPTRLAELIAARTGWAPAPEVRIEQHEAAAVMPPMPGMPPEMRRMHRMMGAMPVAPIEMRIAIAMPSGGWLNVATRFHRPPLQWAWNEAATFAVSAALIAAALWLALGRLTGPLRQLSEAAERFGRGETVAGIAPRGPAELRRLTDAFNEMQARISRFVEERTRVLAALGHDLRSPLTALRVRAEMVDDEETRERLVATIEEMHEMVEATLAFARGMAHAEPFETVDMAGFAAGLAREASASGQDVTLASDAAAAPVRLRPTAMRRALRNIINNAVRYGGMARISVVAGNATVSVHVDDDGPGIPEADLDRVFDPFLRLETSRSRDTGGTGLGLSIARTIVQAHGGDITLANRPDAGLTATITLPGVPQDAKGRAA